MVMVLAYLLNFWLDMDGQTDARKGCAGLIYNDFELLDGKIIRRICILKIIEINHQVYVLVWHQVKDKG